MDALHPFPPPAELSQTLLPPTSRYHGLAINTLTRRDGREVAYFDRRFLPQQDRFVTLLEHTVGEGERLDHLAGEYLGDAEQFWRIADANNELDPAQLTAPPGRAVKITLPEGIPEPRHA
jgi:hypothetical protein